MISAFEVYLSSHTSLNDSELKRISSFAVAGKLHRNEFILREGEICRHKTFIVTGMLYTYGITNEGTESILQFNPENTWTLDAESYDNQAPSRYNIAAIEDSEILSWNKNDFDVLLSEIPQLRNFSQQLISRAVHSGRQRLLSALSATPEEKYNEFIQNYPLLISRLPLRMIAAYLGISIKTLTRIRHAQFQR